MKFADYPIWARLAAWALLLLLLASVLFPFFWMLSTSFKTLEDYASNPFGPPTALVVGNVTDSSRWSPSQALSPFAPWRAMPLRISAFLRSRSCSSTSSPA
jgi:ABC-type glycerol-3-phosphate transport system permease component